MKGLLPLKSIAFGGKKCASLYSIQQTLFSSISIALVTCLTRKALASYSSH